MRPLLFSLSLALLWGCASNPEPAASPAPQPAEQAQAKLVPADVQGLFDSACTGCHGPEGAAGLDLSAESAYTAIVNHESQGVPGMPLVTPSNPGRSYLLHKVAGTHEKVGGGGKRMPIGGTWGPEGDVNMEDMGALCRWIEAGAPARE